MTAPSVRWNLTGTLRPWPTASDRSWRDCLDAALSFTDVWRTPPRLGLPRLRAALAGHLGLAPERLLITQGVRSAVSGLLCGIRRVLVERPTFAAIPRLAEHEGKDLGVLPTRPLDLSGAFRSDTLIWMTSPARNPDGWSLDRPATVLLEQVGGRPGGPRIVVNQAYHWLAPRAPRPTCATLVGSLHKAAGGGVSLGWLAPPDGDPLLDRPFTGGPPRPWQLAWALFIEEGGLDRLAAQTLQPAQQRCVEFMQRLAGAGVVSDHADPTGGLSALLPLPPGLSEPHAVAVLEHSGVAVSPGAAFLAESPSIRVCFTAVDDQDIEPCARIVARLLAGSRTTDGSRDGGR